MRKLKIRKVDDKPMVIHTKEKAYSKSTIHQLESKNKGLSRFKRNYRESNASFYFEHSNSNTLNIK